MKSGRRTSADSPWVVPGCTFSNRPISSARRPPGGSRAFSRVLAGARLAPRSGALSGRRVIEFWVSIGT